jgi:hypothetical protein
VDSFLAQVGLLSDQIQIHIPDDTSEQPPSIRNGIARGKASIYQQAEALLFRKTHEASWNGTVVKGGDGTTRRHYVDVLIKSLDGKAACGVCATRGPMANFPCAKCLVGHDEQHAVNLNFPLRHKEWMKRVFAEAQSKKTKKDKESVLKNHGLHDVEVSRLHRELQRTHLLITPSLQLFSWGFRFSDPYKCYRYDTCHIDHLGEWAKHLWVLIKEQLEESKTSARFNRM